MTFSTDEIQKLIADIDNLLASGGKRLSKFLSGQAQEPKEVLERIRDFLVRLQEKEALESSISKESSEEPRSPLALAEPSPLLTKFIDRDYNQYPLPQLKPSQEPSTIGAGELNNEFSRLIQPLRSELELLLQERATLIQEIRQLEQKRLQNYSLAQQLTNQEQMITEFLQVLMSRLVPTLTPLIGQTGENSASSSGGINYATSANQSLLESPEGVERLTQLARELDQRLLSLDGTVNVVFEALQRNINTYYESLSQALARMHSKGMQGEQLMASFVNNLTEHLQQSPSLRSSLLAGESETLPSLTEPVEIATGVAPQLLELIQPETSSPLTINSELQETSLTEDLDAVLLQLGVDSSEYSQTPTELPQDISAAIGDEVDQLYASLFDAGDVNNPSLDVPTNDLSASTASPSPLNIAQAPPLSPTVDSAVVTADTGLSTQETLGETTDSSEPQEELFFGEDTDLNSPLSFSTPQIDSLPQIDTQPASVDTINTLTDLLPDADSEVQLLEVSSSVDNATTTATDLLPNADSEVQLLEISSSVDNATTTAAVTPKVAEISLVEPTEDITTSEVLINNDRSELSSDNYIAASPQENLLSIESNQSPAVPDISLDEEQLQQLDRDLANFDRQLNSESQPANNLDVFSELFDNIQDTIPTTSPEDPQIAENTSTNAFSSLAVPQVETEKKKEVTTPVPESSLPPIANSINNPEVSPNILESVWYLGIDLGTTGISAALLNRSTFVVHPIYWSAENPPEISSFQQSFRLPTEVYLPIASVPHGENETIEAHEQTAPAAVAQDKVPDRSATTPATPKSTADPTKNNLYSAQLKPYLQVAIPYKSERQKWEPVLQLNEFSAGPLIWVVRSLSKLLLTLKSEKTSTTPSLMAAAVGISEQNFPQIINNIAGVICTCPSSWSEQYRFNVREALLTSKLIQHPQQVFFVEEAIASLLPELDAVNGEQVKLSDAQGSHPAKTSEHPIVGNTLVINIGTTATEMLLVNLPETLQQLTYNDFMLHSFAYAGKGIEQDIICQLLLPPKSRQSRLETPSDAYGGLRLRKTTTSNPWQWQPSIPGLDQMRWQTLGLEELELPRVGEPDITARIRLQQRLESSLLGQAVLDAALALKLILQHQDSFTLELADQRWILQRRDLESQVFIPFVRRLNRELNKLLVARGIPTEAINQAILTGGVACVGTVNRWLRQKLPSTKIIQDLYLGENGAPNCSRVAYGLAMLPLHPQILDIPRQQYTDYFLFTELLRLLPDRPLSFGEVIQLFEGRGINTRICQQRLLAFLEGELPSGLIPSVTESTWLTQSSQENPDYQAIATAPLFEKQGSLTYRPNSQQLLSLRRYLDAIKASNQQSLEEPYTVNFALEV
ncbi:hypothetical protein [Nostoc sp. 'Lobaria pulmonaria (5183) cyanobiont']|uniref:hypothetical protein n=1 Tax=Nostoc sp. 'Lobaria pulmonaria (5183) cyanobiont' TaxID=1618022 RepID=UPI000CF30D0D|nr:hypothetical protein [Nostoc sp. 'Lobaria pulmonaria (5183) cyanobiont']AVH69535.1 hypothetical protein NLP_0661 [Nostoc sp. 'Lobaria pulmonaria (5183) cyanobiont']